MTAGVRHSPTGPTRDRPAGAHRRLRPAAALVALTALVSGCGYSLQAFPKIGTSVTSGYDVHAKFTNVLDLPADAQVRDGSAVVGQVTSISTHDFLADLTLKIRNNVRLPAGTTAQVRFDSPLGDEYVLLTPPAHTTGALIAEGGSIPADDTGTAPSIEDTLTALGAVLNGGGIDQLQTIVVELDKTLGGNETQIRSVIGQLATTFKSLSDHTGDITSAITAVGNLAAELNSGSAVITNGIDAIAPAVTVLDKENADLHRLLTNITDLSTVTNRIVATSGQDSITDAHALLPVVNQLVGVEAQVGPDLRDIARFEALTPKIAPGNYLQVSVTLHANLNSAPTDATDPGGAETAGTLTGGPAVTALLEGGLP